MQEDRSLPPTAPAMPNAADPYGWMRDTQLPAMRGYLAAERSYYEQQMALLRGLRDELRQEMTGLLAAAEESVRWRDGRSWYCTRTVPGQEFEQFRRAAGRRDPVQVLLDENVLLSDPACGGGYVALGVREVSPDGRLLAYSVDFAGDEVYQLRIRDLASGQDLPDRIERTCDYGLAWAADAPFPALRGDRLWNTARTRSGGISWAPARTGTCWSSARMTSGSSSPSGPPAVVKYLFIETESRDTTETLFVPAVHTGSAACRAAAQTARHRIPGSTTPAGRTAVTSTWSATTPRPSSGWSARRCGLPALASWTEVIAGAPDTRLVCCDVFGRYRFVTKRHAASPQLRVLDRETGAQRLIKLPARIFPSSWRSTRSTRRPR